MPYRTDTSTVDFAGKRPVIAVDQEKPAYLKTGMQKASTAAINAYLYHNFFTSSDGLKKRENVKHKKIISPYGFPASIKVSYKFAPLGTYTQGSYLKRDVKFFVLHSFGHDWNDGQMNRKGNLVEYTYQNKKVYIVKGSVLPSLYHPGRFGAGLSANFSISSDTSVHFFIDRLGNLTVCGDCDDIFSSTASINIQQIGVELEEAFYVTEMPSAKNPIKYVNGNVYVFPFTNAQYLTLSILIRKIQIGFPTLKTRAVVFDKKIVTKSSSPCYTMHDCVRDANHRDVSPHFKSRDKWDALFNEVDKLTRISTPEHAFLSESAAEAAFEMTLTAEEQLWAQTILASTQSRILAAQRRADLRSKELASQRRGQTSAHAGNLAASRAQYELSSYTAASYAFTTGNQVAMYNPTFEIVNGHQVGSDDIW